MLATRSVGWRLNTPWTTSDAIVSWMARSDDEHLAEDVALAEASKFGAPPHAAAKRVVAAVAEVERDRDRRLGEAGPHRVVQLVAERPATCRCAAGHRRRADVHDARAALEQRVDLGDARRRGRRARASARR